jgi:uncharacterized membrane protein
LLFLALPYRLCPDPRLLLILQSVALGTAAIPLYWIAYWKTDQPSLALIVAFCYLAYPALGFLNLFDFHPIVFSIPLLFLAYWALLKEQTTLFWVVVLLALLTKEETIVPIGTWGIISLLNRKRRRIGLGLLMLAGVWAFLCLSLIVPYHNEGQPYRFWQLWSHLPGFPSQTSVRGSVVAMDFKVIIPFLSHLVLPLWILPFLGPASLAVALPPFLCLPVGWEGAGVTHHWLSLSICAHPLALPGDGGGVAMAENLPFPSTWPYLLPCCRCLHAGGHSRD